jgi:hypothetical protein
LTFRLFRAFRNSPFIDLVGWHRPL